MKAIKKVTSSNVNKASNIPNSSLFIIKKQETINMQIDPLKLLITSIIHKLKSALNVSKLLHLGSPTFEIYILKDLLTRSLLAKSSQHNVSNKQIDF